MIMLLHLARVDDVMCFKHISFLILVQKKRSEVTVGRKWNLPSIMKDSYFKTNDASIFARLHSEPFTPKIFGVDLCLFPYNP